MNKIGHISDNLPRCLIWTLQVLHDKNTIVKQCFWMNFKKQNGKKTRRIGLKIQSVEKF